MRTLINSYVTVEWCRIGDWWVQ